MSQSQSIANSGVCDVLLMYSFWYGAWDAREWTLTQGQQQQICRQVQSALGSYLPSQPTKDQLLGWWTVSVNLGDYDAAGSDESEIKGQRAAKQRLQHHIGWPQMCTERAILRSNSTGCSKYQPRAAGCHGNGTPVQYSEQRVCQSLGALLDHPPRRFSLVIYLFLCVRGVNTAPWICFGVCLISEGWEERGFFFFFLPRQCETSRWNISVWLSAPICEGKIRQ